HGQDVVVANNVSYPVVDIKGMLRKPIAPDSSVKALVRSRGKDDLVAMILRVLGPKMTLRERITKVLEEAEVRREFPKRALREASVFAEKVSNRHIAGREDLSSLHLCTIDGESAKDFDDAVFARKKGKNIEVIVAIADVSNYVKEGSGLD